MNNEKKQTAITRLLSGLVLFPVVATIVIFGNALIMDITVSLIAMISVCEYYKCFKNNKKANPSLWYMLICCLLIMFTHVVSTEALRAILISFVPISILILIGELILTSGKKKIIDVAVTLLGICYIPLMMLFLSVIRENFKLGKILIWYVFISAWGSDIFAYLVGKNFGKRQLTKLSKGKTVEGAIAGVIGAMILSLIYTVVINSIFEIRISYLLVGIISIILSIIGQIGDIGASSIKRYCGVKDFSELIPGHGGMLDRIDSVIFIAPFAYILLGMLI